VSDFYVQFALSRQTPMASGAVADMPRTLQQCFRLILSSLLPPSPGTLASPLLKRELLLALGTIAKHVQGTSFLIPELSKMLEMYQPSSASLPSSPARTRAAVTLGPGEAKGNETASGSYCNSSGSGSDIPIVAAASFNQSASGGTLELRVGGGGAGQDADTVIAIAEVLQHVLQKAGDSSSLQEDRDQEQEQEQERQGEERARGAGVMDAEYVSPREEQLGQQSAAPARLPSAKTFWKRLIACAYIGSFEQVNE
jgi:hypothetical protein